MVEHNRGRCALASPLNPDERQPAAAERRAAARVVLVRCDGLGDRVARAEMGYLEHLVEAQVATRYTSRAALPTVSRPNYETLHTGVAPDEHGITGNAVVRASRTPNLFSLASRGGRRTGAVAYSWFSKLYVRCPFEPDTDLEYDDPAAAIQHGRFYRSEAEPDPEVIARAVLLSLRHPIDYLLVHTMGADYAGHLHGSDSNDYRCAVRNQDEQLAVAIPKWLDRGYTVIVTADHGAGVDRSHGGTGNDLRVVPLYAINPDGCGRGDSGEVIDHTQVEPTIADSLGLERPHTMRAAPFAI